MEVRQLIKMLQTFHPSDDVMQALWEIEGVLLQAEQDEYTVNEIFDCTEVISDIVDQRGIHEYVPDYKVDHHDPHEYSVGHCSMCIIPN